jgi:hypothetical protein
MISTRGGGGATCTNLAASAGVAILPSDAAISAATTSFLITDIPRQVHACFINVRRLHRLCDIARTAFAEERRFSMARMAVQLADGQRGSVLRTPLLKVLTVLVVIEAKQRTTSCLNGSQTVSV